MFKRITLLLLLVFAFKGCTRDDICPEGTATTPKLIITFYNNQNPNNVNLNNRKDVDSLSIETDYEDSVLVLAKTITDSIAIPLSTTSDTTKYRFIRTRGTADNPEINIDKVMFIYSRQDLYVNRACGFKAQFNGIVTVLEDEGSENWIQNITTITDTIIDEEKAHLTFFH